MGQAIAKEITSPDGRIYRLKKPLYKQGLFWASLIGFVLAFILLLLVLGLVIVNGSLSEENAKLGGRSQSSLYYNDYQQKLDSYQLGESVTFKDGAKVTVKSIETSKQRKMSDEATGEAIVVQLEVENTSNHRLLINPYAFNLYDEDGSFYVLDGSTFDKAQIGTNLGPAKRMELELIFDGENNDYDIYHLAYDRAEWSKRGASSTSSDDRD
ncbi:DUF4352 domain-containing protein [Streptococcus oricebi]|uniref:DUF4352 domain-containing protein n=1 Tax=Streptococcus oricebi TaxID=1547447 RepID=A0ABS5B4P1_9STRE|nr:DUF4352 domain-containing protein [Streptococcus oricebi]MBP2623720.1 DUF4352 domain-containing protein [Streptococcus oricebi]